MLEGCSQRRERRGRGERVWGAGRVEGKVDTVPLPIREGTKREGQTRARNVEREYYNETEQQ